MNACGFGEIGGGRAVLDGERSPPALADDAPRAARHLGHHVGAEALDDLVERAGTGGRTGELLDQLVAARDGFAASTGWPSR
jgi:hypothetical protein